MSLLEPETMAASLNAFQARIRAFAQDVIAPAAAEMDRREELRAGLIGALADQGILGLTVPPEYSGEAIDAYQLGLLHEEIGAVCGSTRSLLTVHQMVIGALTWFGSGAQKDRWLPRLRSGATIGALALTEQQSGSDPADLRTEARRVHGGWRLDGTKCWISFGGTAGLFLVIARGPEGPQAFLVPAASQGLTVQRIGNMLGYRASDLSNIVFDGCYLDDASDLGPPGVGFSLVALAALDLGRFGVAWGCVGAARACLEAAVRHVRLRQSKGQPLIRHALIRRQLTIMVSRLQGARLVCARASQLRCKGAPDAIAETMLAKYVAAQALAAISHDAVHMLGASGLTSEHPAERHFRDSQVVELIEGSNEILELALADFAGAYARIDAEALYER